MPDPGSGAGGSMSALNRILVCTLIALLSVPVAALAQDGPRRIETTDNADYFGFDLRTVQNIGLDQCKAECLADRQCKAFTYNVKAGWCFLKSDYNTINPFAGAVAGRVVTDGEPDLGMAPNLTFVKASVLDEARAYRDRTLARYGNGSSIGVAGLVSQADAALASGDMDGAVRTFAMAAAAAPERSDLWASLSRTALAYPASGPEPAHAAFVRFQSPRPQRLPHVAHRNDARGGTGGSCRSVRDDPELASRARSLSGQP
jgi:hypothetical protein